MARYDTQAYVYWTTRKFAEDAKDWIERQVPGEPLLHGWTSIEPWQWEIMFNEAGLSIGRECFDEAEKVRRIWARVKSGRG
jgi:hypothetical protein